MNICLVGSMRDMDRIEEIGGELRQKGNSIIMPIDTSSGRFADQVQTKNAFMKGMFDQIKKCDTVLAVNDRPRGGLQGYIGPNTFLMLGMAMSLGKPIFCLAKWDPRIAYAEELDAMGIQLLDIKLRF